MRRTVRLGAATLVICVGCSGLASGAAPAPPSYWGVQQSIDGIFPPDPVPLDGDEDRHDAEPGGTNGHGVGLISGRLVAAVASEPANGMGKIPEVAKGLPLNKFQQRGVVEHPSRHP